MHRILAAALLIAATAPATALTYVAKRAVGDGRIDLSITTDDTLGVLATANIVDWRIVMTNAAGSFTLNGPASGDNSAFLIEGRLFTATATALRFDFDGRVGQYVLVRGAPEVEFGPYYCIYTRDCAPFPYSETISPTVNFTDPFDGTISAGYRDGNFVIARAVAAVVPEPAAWMLLLGGFGAVGAMLRRGSQPSAISETCRP